jgi:hypothetical protein
MKKSAVRVSVYKKAARPAGLQMLCQTRRSTATTLPSNFALPPGIGV